MVEISDGLLPNTNERPAMMTPEEIQECEKRANELLSSLQFFRAANALSDALNLLLIAVRPPELHFEEEDQAAHDLRLILGLDREAELKEQHKMLVTISRDNDSLRAEIERLKEANAVLQSQVDNADINLEQVRLCMRSENDQLKAQVQLLNDRLSVARSAFSAAFPGKQLPTEQAKE